MPLTQRVPSDATVLIMISRFLKIASLLFAAIIELTVVATAEDDRIPIAKITVWEDWVGHKEAEYRFGDKVANTKHIELSVKALPKERLTILKSQKEWKEFVERFARTDKESGKPIFARGHSFYGYESHELTGQKPAKFTPDFESEAVVILSVSKAQNEDLMGFLDIEVYKNEDRLRTFVFFGSGQPVVDNDRVDEAVAGYLYMVSIPRELTKLPVEIRMAYQSWGRICSEFSPPITNPDDVEGQHADRDDQGAGQPASALESKLKDRE